VDVQKKAAATVAAGIAGNDCRVASMTGSQRIMTCSSTASTAYGSTSSNSQLPIIKGCTGPNPPLPSTSPNPLERLAHLVNSNDRLMDELTTSRARIDAARIYLDSPGCNDRFGSAHLDRCRARHSGILAQLRANRIEALRLLGEGAQRA